ncbi:MAG: FHA domain-containing protein [Myxococcales bacterium]|nr:FHA domain-containing protein [Myxococcales bacterium]
MTPLRDLLEACRQLDRETFCAMHAPGALVHTSLDHQLVDDSAAGASTLRSIGWAEMTRASAEAYKALFVEPRVGRDKVVIGRAPHCDLTIDDVSLAERHAEVSIDGSSERPAFRIRALEDLLGTRVNDERLGVGVWRELRSGTRLQLGFTRFFFFSSGDLYVMVRQLFEVAS